MYCSNWPLIVHAVVCLSLHHEACMCVQDDTAALVRELSQQMAELLKANRELREENEYLRKIY